MTNGGKMKKLIMVIAAAACMLSVSAMSIGIRGDADFGMATLEKNEDSGLGANLEKPETITSGSAGLWIDMPIINLGIISVGFRPEAEIAIGEGFAVKDDEGKSYKLNQTSITFPIFLDACVNIAMLRVSAGVGPYVTMPLSFKETGKALGTQQIQTPSAGWESHSWGLAAYVQAGLKLGAGYLVADARVSAPFSAAELKTVATGGEDSKTLVETKTYKVGVGLGYEFKF